MVDENRQAQIDQIDWYHEFDFGGGLRARSRTADVEWHRAAWKFIEKQLEQIDFRDKSVLEIGTWDGYWSFFAERRGASEVLATDDSTQNWSNGRGLRLAKELLRSSVDIDQDRSIYDLASLNRKFDVVICLGVFYHLIDPFYAFAQMRHCCHPGTIVLLEGAVARAAMRADEVRYTYGDASLSVFTPSAPALRNMLTSAYLRVQSQTWFQRPGHYRKANELIRQVKGLYSERSVLMDRVFMVCTPFEGINEMHPYKPPFGLAEYDDRYRKMG